MKLVLTKSPALPPRIRISVLQHETREKKLGGSDIPGELTVPPTPAGDNAPCNQKASGK